MAHWGYWPNPFHWISNAFGDAERANASANSALGYALPRSRDCMQFQRLFSPEELETAPPETVPRPRSGHRICVDEDYLYVVGGFTRQGLHGNNAIFKELWALNLLTKEWRRYSHEGSFPTQLASFAMVQCSPYSRNFMVFGGSGVEFGLSSTNFTFHLSVDNQLHRVTSTRLRTTGNRKEANYGNAMIMGSRPDEFYVVGGTTGINFNLDVHRLRLEGSDKKTWNWTKLNTSRDDIPGAYRLEVILDDNKLFLFGGGTSHVIRGFEQIDVFDLNINEFTKMETLPDSVGRYPKPRRCHSATQWGRNVIIAGGCSNDTREEEQGQFVTKVQVYGDVWILNLDTMKWRRHPYDLIDPVFFHDAAITKDGCLILYGGTLDEYSRVRTNNGQMAWMAPPSLSTLASITVAKTYPNTFSGVDRNAKFSSAANTVANVFLNKTHNGIRFDNGSDFDYILEESRNRRQDWRGVQIEELRNMVQEHGANDHFQPFDIDFEPWLLDGLNQLADEWQEDVEGLELDIDEDEEVDDDDDEDDDDHNIVEEDIDMDDEEELDPELDWNRRDHGNRALDFVRESFSSEENSIAILVMDELLDTLIDSHPEHTSLRETHPNPIRRHRMRIDAEKRLMRERKKRFQLMVGRNGKSIDLMFSKLNNATDALERVNLAQTACGVDYDNSWFDLVDLDRLRNIRAFIDRFHIEKGRYHVAQRRNFHLIEGRMNAIERRLREAARRVGDSELRFLDKMFNDILKKYDELQPRDRSLDRKVVEMFEKTTTLLRCFGMPTSPSYGRHELSFYEKYMLFYKKFSDVERYARQPDRPLYHIVPRIERPNRRFLQPQPNRRNILNKVVTVTDTVETSSQQSDAPICEPSTSSSQTLPEQVKEYQLFGGIPSMPTNLEHLNLVMKKSELSVRNHIHQPESFNISMGLGNSLNGTPSASNPVSTASSSDKITESLSEDSVLNSSTNAETNSHSLPEISSSNNAVDTFGPLSSDVCRDSRWDHTSPSTSSSNVAEMFFHNTVSSHESPNQVRKNATFFYQPHLMDNNTQKMSANHNLDNNTISLSNISPNDATSSYSSKVVASDPDSSQSFTRKNAETNFDIKREDQFLNGSDRRSKQ